MAAKTVVRARAYDPGPYWNYSCIPEHLQVGGQAERHPGRCCAIFVVHGIGRRTWTETAATLRSGFEDALEDIKEWQEGERKRHGSPPGVRDIPLDHIPPPFVLDGFWSDYQDVEATFKKEWGRFAPRERLFFAYLWKLRASAFKTFWWFFAQQLRLISPWMLFKVEPWIYFFMYFPLQVVGTAALILGLLRYRVIYKQFLVDVRMYVSPRGTVEQAIVQRIDYRVGEAFLKLIGLDWEFRRLPQFVSPFHPCSQIEASGEHVTFQRVVWVSHSLGTIISYNVLSDLFHRADELELHGDAEQQEGVQQFRKALRRFVTLGSPLDMIATLFEDRALRPWPENRSRKSFLCGGDRHARTQDDESSEWWVNFYHVLDPISAPVLNKLICGQQRPVNYHVRGNLRSWILSIIFPGWAHVSYWTDMKTLRYILGRTYGREFLWDEQYQPHSELWKGFLNVVGKVFWAGLLIFVPMAVVRWSEEVGAIWEWLTSFLGA